MAKQSCAVAVATAQNKPTPPLHPGQLVVYRAPYRATGQVTYREYGVNEVLTPDSVIHAE